MKTMYFHHSIPKRNSVFCSCCCHCFIVVCLRTISILRKVIKPSSVHCLRCAKYNNICTVKCYSDVKRNSSVSGKRPAVHHLSALRRNGHRRKQLSAVRIYRLLCRGRSGGFGLRRDAYLSASVMVSSRNRVAFVRRVKRRADRSLIHHCSVLKHGSRSDELLTGQYLRRFRRRPGRVYA